MNCGGMFDTHSQPHRNTHHPNVDHNLCSLTSPFWYALRVTGVTAIASSGAVSLALILEPHDRCMPVPHSPGDCRTHRYRNDDRVGLLRHRRRPSALPVRRWPHRPMHPPTHPPTHPLPLTMRFVCVIAATNSRRSAVSSRPSNLPPNTAQLRCSLDHHLYSQIASRRCDYIIAQTPPDSDHPPCLCAFWR